MVEDIEKILKKLISGVLKPDKEFQFEPGEGSGSDEVHFDIRGTDYWISSNINWSCSEKTGLRGDWTRPDDPIEYVMDHLEIDNFSFGDGEDVNFINLKEYPSVRKLFAEYITEIWYRNIGSVAKQPLKLTMESIKKYDQFILEWGYGGEGGVASKDPIKVSSRMITEIDLEEDEEEFDTYVPILKDMSEND